MKLCKCGHQVASNARLCPHCGQRFTHPFVLALAVIFGVFIFMAVLGGVISAFMLQHHPAATAAASTAVDPWNVEEQRNPMDGSPEVTLSREASNQLPGYFGGSIRPVLYVRCVRRKTAVIVDVGKVLQPDSTGYDSHRTRIKLDGILTTHLWTEATDSKSLFAEDPQTFARRLAVSKIFSLEVVPFQEAHQTIDFNLNGLAADLPKVAAACKWRR